MNHDRSLCQEMVAALCLIGDGEQGKELFAFAPSRDRESLERIAGRLCREGELDRSVLLERIKRLGRMKSFSPLEEIHPGWIMEKMEKESPRLVGLLCRFLPGEKVHYLIHHLQPHERNLMPKVGDAYGVPPEIVEVVRFLVEKKLTPSLPPSLGETFTFFDSARMKMDDLRILFWDLGLEEIRKAFYAVEPQVLRTFLARFSPKEAGEIRARIENGAEVSPGDKSQAQKYLVSLSFSNDPFSSGGLLREIGYSVFVRALLPDDRAWAQLICEKLVPQEGYRLKRVMLEAGHPSMTSPSEALRQKEAILTRAFHLAEKGLIRRYWKDDREVELTHKENAA